MNWKVQLRNPKIQQGVLEVVFPLAGYFFWDWTLLIIVVFYLIDFLASQILFTRRLAKIITVYNEKFVWVLPLSIIVTLAFTLIFVFVLYQVFDIHYFILEKGLNSELLTFAKKELWFLFPVVLLSYYMMDKMFFFMPRRFLNYSVRPYLYKNIISNAIALFLILVGTYIFEMIRPSDVVAIFGIVIIKLFYDVVIKKYGLKID